MSSTEPDPQATRLSNLQGNVSSKLPHASFWIKELPFSLLLILTIIGVAYTTVVKQPIIVYWELLAPVIALVCVGAGWPNANDKNARLRLIGTQALHWIAFLLVMNMMLLPSVQKILNASATGLSILTLLALGTFTAGVHVLSWQVCLLGLIMALCVPAAAWIEVSALIVVLVAAAVLVIGVVFWWHWHRPAA
jgi:hypothetical protein